MVSSRLSDTVVELVSGAALVEVAALEKEHHIALRVGSMDTTLLKPGLYRFEASPGRVRVYDGRAEVTQGKDFIVVTKGREGGMGSVLRTSKFSVKDTDELSAWSEKRPARGGQANVWRAGRCA